MRADILPTVPRAAGVYLMKDARGAVLYVGKAKNLRARVRSYVRADGDGRPHVRVLLLHVVSIETIVTATEQEALLLEHTLIRKHRPRYNIIFRDDKSYVSVRVNLSHAFPGVYRTRRVVKDGARYFGPYTDGTACRETIELVTRFFRLRTCSDREFSNRSRPCLQYQIGRCTAPCVGLVDAASYRLQVDQAVLLLQGRRNELTKALTTQMRAAAVAEQFEAAVRWRDLLGDIEKTVEPQHVVRHRAIDRDYFGWAQQGAHGAVAVLAVREGRVMERGGAVVPVVVDDIATVIETFALQYYQAPRVPPPEICVPCTPARLVSLREHLSALRGGPVRVKSPHRGADSELLALAATNAEQIGRAHALQEHQWAGLAEKISAALELSETPAVIECVDISNWQGKEAVGAITCFIDGAKATARYRKFNIRGPHEPNDYAMMHEVLTRRLTNPDAPPAPDLLVIDGGKGQLHVAQRVLSELGAKQLPCVAIAKPHGDEICDKLFIVGRKNPLNVHAGDPVLLFFQRVRDETHRFAITHQRSRRRVAPART